MVKFLCLVLFFLTVCKVLAEELPFESHSPNSNCSEQNFGPSEENYAQVPVTFPFTSFTCWGRYDGYYADVEVDCTIFHYCQTWSFPSGRNETVKWDFVCPHNTIFNQKLLSCIPPSTSFECQDSPSYYWVNKNLYPPNAEIEVNRTSDSSYYTSQTVNCPCENPELKPNHVETELSSQNDYGNYAHSVPLYPAYSEFHGPPENPSYAEYSQFYPTESIQSTGYHDFYRFNKDYELNVANPASFGHYNLETPHSYQVNNVPSQQNFPVNKVPENYIEFSTRGIPVGHDTTLFNSKSFNGSVKNLETPQLEKLNVSAHRNQDLEYHSFEQQPYTSEFPHNKQHFSHLNNIVNEVSDTLKSHFSDNLFSRNSPNSNEQIVGLSFLSNSNGDQFTVQSDKQNSIKKFGDQQYAGAMSSNKNFPLNFASLSNFTKSSIVESAETEKLPQQYDFNLNNLDDAKQHFNLTQIDLNRTLQFSEPNTVQSEDLRIFSGDQIVDLNQSHVPFRQNSQMTLSLNSNEPFVTYPLVIPTFPNGTNTDEATPFFLEETNGNTLISKNVSDFFNANGPLISSFKSVKNGNFHFQPNLTTVDDNSYEGSGETLEANVKDDDIEELVLQDNRQSRTRYFLVN